MATTFNGDHSLKAKMVERARDHRINDRIVHGTYSVFMGSDVDREDFGQVAVGDDRPHSGDYDGGTENNPQKWLGCGIGCLAADVGKVNRGERFASFDARQGCKIIAQDFDLPWALLMFAEAGFESDMSPDAYKWPERFAAAIPVGVEITDEMALEWWEEWTEQTNGGQDGGSSWALESRDFILEKMQGLVTDEEDKELLEGILAAVDARANLEEKVIDAQVERVTTYES